MSGNPQQKEARGLRVNFLVLVLGVLLGGFVTTITDWWRVREAREANEQALLQHVKQCCRKAEQIARRIDPVISEWRGSPEFMHDFDRLDLAFWKSALADLQRLPPDHLPRLIAFYDRCIC